MPQQTGPLSLRHYTVLFFALCIFATISLPRFFALSAHWSSDEARWLRRSADFMDAVTRGDFSETLIAYHPGVITMWVSGLRTFFLEAHIDIANLAASRWFIGIAVWFSIGVCGILLNRLFGLWEAITSVAFLAFSPFFLAQARRVHTDALATVFIIITVLLFLLYCETPGKYNYLIFSGITFGLACLSKSYSLILIVWVVLCFFLFWYFDKENKRHFFSSVAILLCFSSCALLTAIVFWPVFWTVAFVMFGMCLAIIVIFMLNILKKEHMSVLLALSAAVGLIVICLCIGHTAWRVFDRVNWAVTTPHEVEHFFLGKVVYDPGWLFYPFVLSIKSTPFMLPLVFAGIFLFWKNRKHSVETEDQFRKVLALVVVVLIFTVCLSATSKKFSRYLLPAFPILEILAALGLVGILRWLYSVFDSRFGVKKLALKYSFTGATCFLLFFIQVWPVLQLHPYYGTYYNPCWKVTDITKIITVGEASGLDIAANYLNTKPKPENLVVQVSPLAAEFVYRYFKGRVYRADREAGLTPDYEVVYIRDSQIGRVPQTGTLNGELEHQISLNGIDHVWIYRVKPKEH